MFPRLGRPAALLASLALVLTLSACRNDMHDQPRYEPMEQNANYADSAASRPTVDGTVARGFLRDNEDLYPVASAAVPSNTVTSGAVTSDAVTSDAKSLAALPSASGMRMPFPVSIKVLERGQQRFNIYCTPCHGVSGYGDGMVVRRGYRPPPSYHSDRLRNSPPAHFFDVMTNGFGAMPDYATQIPTEDRWAIAAYIKALQYSQNASLADVPAEDRSKLK